jgi:hypothetical protein
MGSRLTQRLKPRPIHNTGILRPRSFLAFSLDFSQFLLINGQFCHLDRSMSVKVPMRSGEICFLLAFPAASLC